MRKKIVFRIEQIRSKEVWYKQPDEMKNIIDMWVNADNWDELHTPENYTITLQSTDCENIEK